MNAPSSAGDNRREEITILLRRRKDNGKPSTAPGGVKSEQMAAKEAKTWEAFLL